MREVAFLDEIDPRIRAAIADHVPRNWNLVFTASNQASDRQAAAATATAALIIGTGIDTELIAAAPNLRFVQKLGAGLDRIDAEACRERGIGVARLQAGNAIQVAEHTVMLMLAALRRLPYFDRKTREGEWLKEEGRGTQRQLFGKTVGLVGLGAIGQHVARRLAGFNVRVIYSDPTPGEPMTEQELHLTRCSLDDLVAIADVISLHAPLTPETRHLIDARRLSLAKRGTTIINCARGGLIDEVALVEAMNRGQVSAAALDTLEVEPIGETPLRTRDDVVLTPHLAGATIENFVNVFERGVANVEYYLNGRPLPPGELVIGMDTSVRR
jgi:phosphoglycerate dehydrogenase-like enzyme